MEQIQEKEKTGIDIKDIKGILKKFHNTSESLIAILQEIQKTFNYIPQESVSETAKYLDIPLHQVYSVATFYKAFSLKPKGRNIIQVCMGTACHVRGAQQILEEIERQIGIKSGDTSEDGEFSLETVNCLGACALGPIMVVNGEYHGNMVTSKVSRLLKEYSKK
ncbi:MAG: NADH-quinone oxidoreductase subunit NuoE [Spirochaetes bacterium]|nr:MAG: NADH-quinone oxidoreductase subunit NuoE [Spirochaetota bacterium]